jgi:hypothetical protein
MVAGVSNASDPIGTVTSTKSVDSSIKRKCLFPYLNENNKKILSD